MWAPASDAWGRCLGESSDIPGGERRLPPAQAAGMAPVKAGPAPESVQDLGLAPAAPVGAECPPKVWGDRVAGGGGSLQIGVSAKV